MLATVGSTRDLYVKLECEARALVAKRAKVEPNTAAKLPNWSVAYIRFELFCPRLLYFTPLCHPSVQRVFTESMAIH